jgi:3-methyl-2-oxobutanoate hydroxymethyltransferase
MPFMSYNVSVEQALQNAAMLVQKGLAQGVKLEGGRAIVPQVKALVEAGIPVMGHLGLTPQSVHAIGGYKVQGRGEKAAQAMLEDALALQDAGVFSIVLEMVPMGLAGDDRHRRRAALRRPDHRSARHPGLRRELLAQVPEALCEPGKRHQGSGRTVRP